MAKAEHLRVHEGSSERAKQQADLRRRLDPQSEEAGVTNQEMHRDVTVREQLQSELSAITADHREVMQMIDFKELEASERKLDELINRCEGLLLETDNIKDGGIKEAAIKSIDDARFALTLDRYAPLRSFEYQTVSRLIDTIGSETVKTLVSSKYSEEDISLAKSRLRNLSEHINNAGYNEVTSYQLSNEIWEYESRVRRYSEDPGLYKIEHLVQKVWDRRISLPEKAKPNRRADVPLIDDDKFRKSIQTDLHLALNEIATLDRYATKLVNETSRRQIHDSLRRMKIMFEEALQEFENFPELVRCDMLLHTMESRYESGELISDEELKEIGATIDSVKLARPYDGWRDVEQSQVSGIRFRLRHLEKARNDGLKLNERRDDSLNVSIGRLIEQMYGSPDAKLSWAYEELGLDPKSADVKNPIAIKHAFHDLSKRFHPDRYRQASPDHPQVIAAEKRMRSISKAYSELQKFYTENKSMSSD